MEAHVRAKFKKHAQAILDVLHKEDSVARYFATELALPQLRVSRRESVVSFTDVLGFATRLAAFSGTMGSAIVVPDYFDPDDARWEATREYSKRPVPLLHGYPN